MEVEHPDKALFNRPALLSYAWVQVVLGLIATWSVIKYNASIRQTRLGKVRFALVALFLYAHIVAILTVAILLLL